MHGPYSAKLRGNNKTIEYNGNRIFQPLKDVEKISFSKSLLKNRLENTIAEDRFKHLHQIDSEIFFSAVEYFKKIGAEWCNLPLTTLMISSPGEIYAGKTIDYSTDTLPVDISWFNNKRSIFLSESSQFYLELRLLINKVNKVFSIYNSFRKEKSDFTHLSEFQHIEFEGKVSFSENIKIAIGLLNHITKSVVKNCKVELGYFLTDREIDSLSSTFDVKNFKTITFKDVLKLLHKSTDNDKYKKFSLANFGSWEEIRITEILGKHLIVTEFPMLQIPFYHNVVSHDENGTPLAENADIVLYGFREVIGSGARISDALALKEKAKIFNLPISDYEPYLKTRNYKHYVKTAGFGMGWQRFTHWLLKLPFIWESTHIPRTHYLPIP